MPKSDRPPVKSEKKQSTILELFDKSINSRGSKRKNEVIDLTDEDCSSQYSEIIKIEEEQKTEVIEPIEPILCPLCNKDMTLLIMEEKVRHVDFCLTLHLNDSQLSSNSLALKSKSNTKPSSKAKKQKTSSSAVMMERERFKNRKLSLDDDIKINEKAPANISCSKRRACIPDVKILTFEKSTSDIYKVAVDAFNYSPHEEIEQYFLTHFHSDHYGGITKSWFYERVFGDDNDFSNDSKYRKILYCSEITADLVRIRFHIDQRFIRPLCLNKRYLVHVYDSSDLPNGGKEENGLDVPGLYVTLISANHCPGSAIFLFESISLDGSSKFILHCGDFRVNKDILAHNLLNRFSLEYGCPFELDEVYLDTTYFMSLYNFPKQEKVCEALADMFNDLLCDKGTGGLENKSLFTQWFGSLKQSRITDFLNPHIKTKKKFLILIGTYLIGKEKIAISLLKKLKNTPIFVLNVFSKDKFSIIRCIREEYLNSVLTDDDLGKEFDGDCMIHLVPMKIVDSNTDLSNYFNHNGYFQHFERCVGVRPSGWTFSGRGASKSESFIPNTNSSELTDLIQTYTPFMMNLVDVMGDDPGYSYHEDILPQVPLGKSSKGKNDMSNRIYVVPYSEHSSFRELCYFLVFFRIKKTIPTVNIHNTFQMERMSLIIKSLETLRNIKLNRDVVINEKLEKVRKLTLSDF